MCLLCVKKRNFHNSVVSCLDGLPFLFSHMRFDCDVTEVVVEFYEMRSRFRKLFRNFWKINLKKHEKK